MKSTILTFIFCLALITGSWFQAYGQARSSVRYTIVVTEDMLASNTRSGQTNGTARSGLPAPGKTHEAAADEFKPSSLSVRIEASHDSQSGLNDLLFESEIDYDYFPAFVNVIGDQLHVDKVPADGSNESIKPVESGGYLVVVEYN